MAIIFHHFPHEQSIFVYYAGQLFFQYLSFLNFNNLEKFEFEVTEVLPSAELLF